MNDELQRELPAEQQSEKHSQNQNLSQDRSQDRSHDQNQSLYQSLNQSLNQLRPLFVDLQTTGFVKARSSILEFAWKQPEQIVESFLIKPSQFVSREILKMTGITEEELQGANNLEDIIAKFFNTIKKENITHLIIHYAQFESSYLKDIFESNFSVFQIPIICTHQIGKKLFPGLPSKGIKGLAGYLGFSHQQFKRSSHHVEATEFIWQKLLSELYSKKIESVETLQNFLNEKVPLKKSTEKASPSQENVALIELKGTCEFTPGFKKDSAKSSNEPIHKTSSKANSNNKTGKENGPSAAPELIVDSKKIKVRNSGFVPAPKKPAKFTYRLEASKRLAVPKKPGIYMMKNQHGEILYIGKASNLHSRVNSYFRGAKSKHPRLKEMTSQVWDVETIAFESNIEACIFESEEIKRVSPPYNVALKTEKRRLLFFNRELTQYSDRSSGEFLIGPVTSYLSFDFLFKFSDAVDFLNFDQHLFFDPFEEKKIVAGFYQFLQNEKEFFNQNHIDFITTIPRDRPLTRRQILSSILTWLRKREGSFSNYEKFRRIEIVKVENLDLNVDNVTAEDLAQKFYRNFMRTALGYLRLRWLNRFANSEVIINQQMGQQVDQPLNQPLNQPISQPLNQPVSHPVNLQLNQLSDQFRVLCLENGIVKEVKWMSKNEWDSDKLFKLKKTNRLAVTNWTNDVYDRVSIVMGELSRLYNKNSGSSPEQDNEIEITSELIK